MSPQADSRDDTVPRILPCLRISSDDNERIRRQSRQQWSLHVAEQILAQSVADAGRIDCVPAWRRWRFGRNHYESGKDDLKKGNLVRWRWNGSYGIGTVPHRRLEQHSLLSILGRSTEFTHDPQQLFKLLSRWRHELRFHLDSICSRIYLLCLACTRSS